jgi:putative ABC transport system permease protein
VVIGIVGALGATRVTRALAFGVSPLDPRIHVVAGITLIATTLLAAIVPARRAAAADPAIALRAD